MARFRKDEAEPCLLLRAHSAIFPRLTALMAFF